MRIRLFSVFAGALLALVVLIAPSAASAAPHPHYNHGLTIAATPNPITPGQGVLIYGQLKGHDSAYKRVYLFHRIDPKSRFTPIGVTHTNGDGFYEFVRADGVVVSNRNWFVVGPGNTHSHTVHEHVFADVTLTTTSANATTAQPVALSGTVFPAHPHQRVLIQVQDSAAGNAWHTISSAYTHSDSSFTTYYKFRTPDSYTLRAYFPGDPRNIAGQSDPLTVTVQQDQNPSFTISGSAAVLTEGQTETISGTLYAAGSTTTTQPNAQVTLYGKSAHSGSFKALTSGTTDGSGNYTFTQMPLHNMVYKVETASSPRTVTAKLFIGVQDVVTIAASAPTVTVGGTVTVSGTVTPDHSGHVIYLQQQNTDGSWSDIQSSYLKVGSQYSFNYTPGEAGTVVLRVLITGGPINLGGVSTPVTITVAGLAPVSQLPPAT
jgi:hypothetical protein